MKAATVTSATSRSVKSHGKILLVGFGPGGVEQMTLRARAAIEEAEVVIGYTTYIKLVAEFLEGKEVIKKSMTEETERCVEAWEQAQLGKTVALISSGDIGVYGMAGPTFEALFERGWTPQSEIKVELVVGTTALNAAASLVGAPLTHDFCSISLSDQLTPWSQIAVRLKAAAEGNFVVALYNPKSGRRSQQIVQAVKILLSHRRPNTPVAIVKSAYRRRQNIQHTSLAELNSCEIGMLCTVLIGNRQSYFRKGLMITPRGYQNKYDPQTGKTLEGESAGRPLRLGLLGWPHQLRKYLSKQDALDLEAAGQELEMSMGDVLSALHSNTGEAVAVAVGDSTYTFEAASKKSLAQFCQLSDSLLLSQKLGKAAWLRMQAKASELQCIDSLLALRQKSGSVELHLHTVKRIYYARCDERIAQVYLLDHTGECLLRLTPVEESPAQAAPITHLRSPRSGS